MSEPSELMLPPGRALDAVTVAEHLLYVQTALAAAISEQPESLAFPSLERIAGRFGLNRRVAWNLRSTLVQTGYLAHQGYVYLTAHPKRGNETEHAGGEQS
jgi:hypothetical protein